MTVSRRQLLAALGAAATVAGCSRSATPADPSAPRSSGATSGPPSRPGAPSADTGAVTSTPGSPTTHAYGSDPSQFGELYRPDGAAKPGTVVIIHGGFWRAQYDLSLGRPLAADLVGRGYTVFNLEYRRVGDGGGWPNTFADVAAGVDLLATLDVDTDHVCAVGHSAGGQLAAWLPARKKLPPDAPGANPKVEVTAAVSQAGVLDMITALQDGVGQTAVSDVMGGTPDQQRVRYTEVDPIELLPVLATVLCVHGRSDDIVPLAQSQAYVAAARRTGAQASLTEVDGDHFTLIDPTSDAWRVVVDALPGLLED